MMRVADVPGIFEDRLDDYAFGGPQGGNGERTIIGVEGVVLVASNLTADTVTGPQSIFDLVAFPAEPIGLYPTLHGTAVTEILLIDEMAVLILEIADHRAEPQMRHRAVMLEAENRVREPGFGRVDASAGRVDGPHPCREVDHPGERRRVV